MFRFRDKDPHRESCRRQHRVIGQYLAIQAWLRNIDCMVLTRVDLEAFLGLRRFKLQRLRWFQQDIEPWFPHPELLQMRGTRSIGSLYLSRVPIWEHLPDGVMTDAERIDRMLPNSPRAQLFSISDDHSGAPSQEQIASQLALLSAGLVDPHQQRRKKRKRAAKHV